MIIWPEPIRTYLEFFYGTVPCDRLPRTLPDEGPSAFIVNTDPHDEPGTHWIALWTRGNVCEILDSYALPLKAYFTAEPLQEWVDRHFKYLVSNGMSFALLVSQPQTRSLPLIKTNGCLVGIGSRGKRSRSWLGESIGTQSCKDGIESGHGCSLGCSHLWCRLRSTKITQKTEKKETIQRIVSV